MNTASLDGWIDWLEERVSPEQTHAFVGRLLRKYSHLYGSFLVIHPDQARNETLNAADSIPCAKGADTREQYMRSIAEKAAGDVYAMIEPILHFIEESSREIFDDDISKRNT